jgi:hypothetical protein
MVGMQPITVDQLTALMAVIDAGAEERGWNQPGFMIRVEPVPGSDELDLGLRTLDDHPLEYLLGFTAPDGWAALGTCSEGWMAPVGSGRRPSQSRGRERMRSMMIVSRDGPVVSGVRRAGHDFEPMPEQPVGMIPDALRRALRLPTDPPDVPVTEYLASLLLLRVANEYGDSGRRARLSDVRPALAELDELARDATWECLRGAVAHADPHPQSPLDPDLADWMDEGMFARWMSANVPPYEALLDGARACVTPSALTEIRAILRRWGLRRHTRRAA